MRRVAAVAALVLLAGVPACAHPSHLGGASAYPAYGAYPSYGAAPYAAVPRHWSGGGDHHHAGGHGASHYGHHRPHHHGHHHRH